METIKKDLERDYNLAVGAYENNDYVLFFRNIRPAIELLCKLLIHDFVQDEVLANDIIVGNVSLWRDKDFGKYKIVRKARPIQGSAYATVFPSAYYFKHPDVGFAKLDEKRIRLRKCLEGNASYLCHIYSTASEIGNHTGESSMNVKTQAMACSIFFLSFFDFLRSNHLVQSATIEFLDNLYKFDENRNNEELITIKNQIIDANNTIDNLKIELIEAKKQRQEAERGNKQLESQILEMEANLKKQQDEIQRLNNLLVQEIGSSNEGSDSTPIDFKKRNDLLSLLTQPITDWDVDEESMDGDQLEIIDNTQDESILVAGCAGSGKSVIAMHKAEQLAMRGEEVILIAYTISLSEYMNAGKHVGSYKFYYHNQWKNLGMPHADYIIVDEIQDFTEEEIKEFISAADKHFMFFGDTAQSIYRQYGKNTLSIEEISKVANLNTLLLYNNYRLPRPIAKITQDYVGVNVPPYRDKVYQNKEKSLPHIIYKESIHEQVISICKIINENNGKSIGVLLPSNENVVTICKETELNNLLFEKKYSVTTEKGRQIVDTLDFTTFVPKVMTYHSAKGLQFDIVILPMYNGASDNESRKALYVAMTRTIHKLYVFYSTPKLTYPLSDVPTRLYLKDEA